jgi:hypothetical protein
MQKGEASSQSAQVEEASWIKRISEVEEEPSPVLAAEVLDALEAEEGGFDTVELSE